MARKVQLYKVQNQNKKNEKAFGKWYARVAARGTVTTRQLAKHIVDHGSPFTEDLVYGVIIAYIDCTREMLLQSHNVQLGNIGTFRGIVTGPGAVTIRDAGTLAPKYKFRVGFSATRSPEALTFPKNFLKAVTFEVSDIDPHNDHKEPIEDEIPDEDEP